MSESLPQQPPEDLPDFGMTTDDGNGRVDLLVREVIAVVHTGAVQRSEALVAIADGVRDISRDHPEVVDITVRDSILREVKPAFEEAGWPMPQPFEF